MYASTRGGLKALWHPYYIVNVVLSLSFILSKKLPFICNILYDHCEIDLEEYHLLIILASFVTLRKRRNAAIPDYVAHFCMFAKACNIVMFWYQSLTYATVYGVLWLIQSCFLFQPVYSGPESVNYFRESTFSEVVEHGNPKVTWIIAFYTVWSARCHSLAPIFSELSHAYTVDSRLRFGKVDVSRCPNLAHKFGVDATTWSNQLPTIILFRGGREIDRRPGLSSKSKKVIKFSFTWESIVSAFSLNQLYSECQSHQSQIRRSKEGLEKAKYVSKPENGTAGAEGKKDK